MNDKWLDKAFIFVQADRLTPSNNSMKAIDPDTGGNKTFGNVRLSADGQEPATHYGCNTLMTEAMRSQVLQAFDNRPWTAVYKFSDGWVWDGAVAHMELQVIEATEI